MEDLMMVWLLFSESDSPLNSVYNTETLSSILLCSFNEFARLTYCPNLYLCLSWGETSV